MASRKAGRSVVMVRRLLYALLLWGIAAVAQSPEGALVGTVLDASGARVAGAKVSIERLESAFQRSTTTDALGDFRFELLAHRWRSEEHTSELQSRGHIVCRLLLEKKKEELETEGSQRISGDRKRKRLN